MEKDAVRRSTEQITVSNEVIKSEVMKKAVTDIVQGLANLTAVVATETIRTAANIAIFGIAKTAELINNFSQKASEVLFDNPRDAKQKSEFMSRLKDNPDKFLEFTKNVKEKLYDTLEKLQQKLTEIKKSIARVSLALNKANRKYHLLSNRIDALGKELEKIKRQIKELEKQPGQEKNLEILKSREKEILNKLEELNRQKLEELNRIKELEEQKKKLEAEKKSLEQDKEKCQDKIKKIDSLEHEFKQTFNLEPENKKDLVERYRENISKKYEKMREENPTEISTGHLAFRASMDTNTFNMDNVTSTKSNMGQEVDESWVEKRLKQANEHGFTVTSPSEQNHEHGGKDEMGGR